ncbi:TRAP transporter large permease subunit [Rhodobacteraceae bacterium NNCM2]|nr:TRAP transporter large permease subunit [Coraliihabitans acroporae]
MVGLVLLLQQNAGARLWTIHNMAPIMFVTVIAGLLTGYPIAFSLGAVGLLFGFVGIELGLFQPDFLQAMTDRVYGTMANETLLAIPFFTFMGLLLERSGLAEDLLDTIGQIFGPVRGGLAFAVILVGALLAATTGIVAASVISMGLISLPIMLRYGYDQQTATGVIIASGTLAQIVPPSLVLIIMADQLGVSVGQMYRASFAPALMLIGLYILYIAAIAFLRPSAAPALPEAARGEDSGGRSLVVVLVAAVITAVLVTRFAPVERGDIALVIGIGAGVGLALAVALLNRAFGGGLISALAQRVILVLVPPLALIFLVLGTILIGLATPTEGGAMGAVGTLLLAWSTGRLNGEALRTTVVSTAELATFVLFILVGARVFSLTFYGVDGHIWIEELLLALPGGSFGFLLFVSALIFVLGFFLDFYEIAFILLPLLIIPAQALGIDLVWFGILVAINLQTSFMSPPFGFSLFFLRSVAPDKPYADAVTGQTIPGISTGTIFRSVLPYIAIHILVICLVASYPEIIHIFDRDTVQLDDSAVDDELNAVPGIEGMGVPTISF